MAVFEGIFVGVGVKGNQEENQHLVGPLFENTHISRHPLRSLFLRWGLWADYVSGVLVGSRNGCGVSPDSKSAPVRRLASTSLVSFETGHNPPWTRRTAVPAIPRVSPLPPSLQRPS